MISNLNDTSSGLKPVGCARSILCYVTVQCKLLSLVCGTHWWTPYANMMLHIPITQVTTLYICDLSRY